MTTQKDSADNTPLKEQPFVSHLLELRDRLLRALAAVAVFFVFLFPFANEIYIWVATPLMAHLPEGSSMIATEVASPFLTPFKLSLVSAVFLAVPFILYQLWAFVAPGLYQHEKRLVAPLVASSTLLFYVGMLFAYYLVFPLVFAFLTAAAPEGVTVATDIARYLDFILTLFFAFGLAFEVPIATFILVWMGVTTTEKLGEKRPYIIVGAFLFGMLLTPPDVISQTLLALPMWLLFEIGLVFSRLFGKRSKPDEETEEVPAAALATASASGSTSPPPPPARNNGPKSPTVPAFDADPSVDGQTGEIDPDRFTPMTEKELDAELDRIEAEDADDEEEFEDEDELQEMPAKDPVEQKLRRVQALRDDQDEAAARDLLYEILAEGNVDQVNVARNILRQLDDT